MLKLIFNVLLLHEKFVQGQAFFTWQAQAANWNTGRLYFGESL
jgi:hypothetical protein